MIAIIRHKPMVNAMYDKRIATCLECDRRFELPMKKVMCKECGCAMNIKARFPDSKCKLGKW